MPQPDQHVPLAASMPQPAASWPGFSAPLRTALAAAAVVAMLGTAGIPWLLSSPARVSRFVARAVPALQADVRCGSVKLGWLGPLVFEDVHLVPRDGSHEPVTFRRVEVSHGLAGILLSMGDLGRLRIEGLEARVVYDAERNSNLKTLILPATDADVPIDAVIAPRPPRRSPVRLQLDVVDAIVRIEGPWSPEPWVSDPINMRASLRPSAQGAWSEWHVEPVQLLADARLEPAVAQGVLAYIAPVLADATRTGGRFSLRLNEATIPVGSPESGHIEGVLSMHAVDLGPGPLVSRIIEALPGQLSAPPAIRIADESHVEFQLADRRVWHKGLAFGFPLAKPGQRLDLRSSGSVGLRDKSLDLKLELPIPGDLPQDRPLLASLAGRTLTARIGGELGAPRVNLEGTLRGTAGEVVGELVDRLRGRPVGPRQHESPPREPQSRQSLPSGPPQPGWRPDATAEGDGGTGGRMNREPPAADRTAAGDGGDGGRTDNERGDRSTADRIKSTLPPDVKQDSTTDAVIDLVGGVLGEIARRRAERQASDTANPQQPPPRRGRLLRRLAPAAGDAPPPLQPVPPPSGGQE
jgi:hypothetical protein